MLFCNEKYVIKHCQPKIFLLATYHSLKDSELSFQIFNFITNILSLFFILKLPRQNQVRGRTDPHQLQRIEKYVSIKNL